MAKNLTLSNILSKFRSDLEPSVTGIDKAAEEQPDMKADEAAAPAEVTPPVEAEASAEVPQDPQQPPEGEVVKKEDGEKVAADVLIDIAAKAVEKEQATLKKEASEFGKLFAHAFLEELEVANLLKTAEESAFSSTIDFLKEASALEALDAITKEAFDITIEALSTPGTPDAITKEASDATVAAAQDADGSLDTVNLPLMLAGITKQAYDLTLEAFPQGGK